MNNISESFLEHEKSIPTLPTTFRDTMDTKKKKRTRQEENFMAAKSAIPVWETLSRIISRC